MEIYRTVISSNFNAVDATVRDIIEILREFEAVNKKGTLFKISFMLREVLNNAVEHGNKFDESKMIECRVFSKDRFLIFNIKDEGDGILYDEHYDKKNDYNMRSRNRGLGLILEYGFKFAALGNAMEIRLDLDKEG